MSDATEMSNHRRLIFVLWFAELLCQHHITFWMAASSNDDLHCSSVRRCCSRRPVCAAYHVIENAVASCPCSGGILCARPMHAHAHIPYSKWERKRTSEISDNNNGDDVAGNHNNNDCIAYK